MPCRQEADAQRISNDRGVAVESVFRRFQKPQSASGFFGESPVNMGYTIVIGGGSESIRG